jgi:transposase
MQRLELINQENIVAQIHRYFEHNEEAKYIHRLHGILLFASKPAESCDSIGALFGNSPRTISNWIKKVNSTGSLESLRSTPQSGRPSRLNCIQQAEIKKVLQEPPENHGIATNIWDGKSLSAYILEHYGIILRVRACQNLFHKLGFSLKRARPVVARGDEQKKEESKKTLRLK